MFEKLLSLLLHAKGGAVATVLVLGASGALVTATVENGLATTTITQPSTTTTGSETTTGSTTTTTTNPAILALFSRTKAEEDPTGTATGNGCSDAAHATNEQVKRVNDAYKTDHAAVQALSKDAAKTDENKKLVKDADNKIKGFRQEAVKAIHGLFKSDDCKGSDDEDEDVDNDDEDEGSTTGTTTGTTSTTTTTVAISCTDAKACADAAIAEMDKVVVELKTKLEAAAAAPATTNASTTTDKGKSDDKSTKGNNGKGKGHSEGKSHNDD